MIADAPVLGDFLSSESLDRFQQVLSALDSLQIPYTCNPNLVRGLDYYSHTAFEITSDQLGAQATVCGGGRYDGLVSNWVVHLLLQSVGLWAWKGSFAY